MKYALFSSKCSIFIKTGQIANQKISSGDFAEIYYSRGRAFLRAENFNGALDDLRRAVKLNPQHYMAYNYLGNTYSKLDQFDKAIEQFTKALAIEPNYGDAYYNRGNRKSDRRYRTSYHT